MSKKCLLCKSKDLNFPSPAGADIDYVVCQQCGARIETWTFEEVSKKLEAAEKELKDLKLNFHNSGMEAGKLVIEVNKRAEKAESQRDECKRRAEKAEELCGEAADILNSVDCCHKCKRDCEEFDVCYLMTDLRKAAGGGE